MCVEILREGDTTTRSDKSGVKKRRNWKKRKRIMGDSQLSLIPHFSDGFRKSRVRSRCFAKPFAKVRGTVESINTVASIDTVARKSIDTIANKSIDTVAENWELQ
ncbi:hypothetical protein DY000_02046582 [Brassica cretica]|uniref:Uncharacterized protein n=1 Tax=Brassica cretica TaxID=69181 RepID=A0ABQ7EUH0_BRACR|nr:hypothetical protein DY000_02046582 [Brassica cretica]